MNDQQINRRRDFLKKAALLGFGLTLTTYEGDFLNAMNIDKSLDTSNKDTFAATVSIQQLLYRYGYTLDEGSAQDVVKLFHENAIVIPAYESDEPISGRSTIETWYANYLGSSRAGSTHSRHKIYNSLIEVSGEEAKAVSLLEAQGIPKTGDILWYYIGRYEDILTNQTGTWLFKQRKISLQFCFPGGPVSKARNFNG